jgi:hypothetical protein
MLVSAMWAIMIGLAVFSFKDISEHANQGVNATQGTGVVPVIALSLMTYSPHLLHLQSGKAT